MLEYNSLVTVNPKDSDFEKIIGLYRKAEEKMLEKLYSIKEELNNTYGYDIINTITSRIKTPKSIINKMKKKNYELNYKNLVQKIDDIAGIRIVCPFKNNIFEIKQIIEEMDSVRIIQEKDYINNPKESGYSAYHLIVEVPVEFKEKELFVKVEIQIRTMAMDFWATAEHKMRYKSKKKISWFSSAKLSIYAKIINVIDNKMTELNEE